MECRDVREMADSFLSEELLTETNHAILRHLETCPACRVEIDARRRLRSSLLSAFERAPGLQARPEFASKLRDRLKEAAQQPERRRLVSRRWFALAAGVVLAAAVGGAFLVNRWIASGDTIARAAVGDHENCALQFRLSEKPVPLEEAARRYDSAYRVLENFPPENTTAAGGPVRVIERHACVYRGRRFAHIVLRYRGRPVSLLVTANDGRSGIAAPSQMKPLREQHVGTLAVVSLQTQRHTILVVGDLADGELAQLAEVVATPLRQRLQGA